MGFDLKYGKVTLEKKVIPDEEPVFVFRAQDALATGVIAHYLGLLIQQSAPGNMIDLVRQQFENFVLWPKKKMPD